MLDDNNGVDDTFVADQEASNKFESYVFSHFIFIFSCVATMGYLAYYMSYVWLMTKFKYHFMEWGIGFSHLVPGTFVDTAFSLDWVFIMSMSFSVLPPLAGLWILLNPRNWIRYDIHRFAILVNFGIVLTVAGYMIFFVWIFASGSSYYPLSFSVPIDFCCKFHGAVAAMFGCSNNNDCLDLPTTPTIHLHTDGVFGAHLYSLGFIALGLIMQVIGNLVFRRYNVNNPETIDGVRGKVPLSLHGINILYLFYVLAFLTCGVLLLDVRYTHEYPSSGPVGIQSARDGSETGGIIAFSCTALLFPMFMLFFMYALRSFVRWRKWAMVGFYACLCSITLIHTYGVTTMMYSRGTANLPGYPNSLASHPVRCCAADTRNNLASQCDNLGECDVATVARIFPWFKNAAISSSQIPTSPRHNVVFIMAFLLTAADVAIIFYLFGLYFRDALGMKLPTSIVQQQPVGISNDIGSKRKLVGATEKFSVQGKDETKNK